MVRRCRLRWLVGWPPSAVVFCSSTIDFPDSEWAVCGARDAVRSRFDGRARPSYGAFGASTGSSASDSQSMRIARLWRVRLRWGRRTSPAPPGRVRLRCSQTRGCRLWLTTTGPPGRRSARRRTQLVGLRVGVGRSNFKIGLVRWMLGTRWRANFEI